MRKMRGHIDVDATTGDNVRMEQTLNLEDPMALIRSRYERHERLPIPRLVSAVQGAGCTAAPSRMRGVNYEVNYGGMCVGTICVEDGVPVLEMSKRETPSSVLQSVSSNVQRIRGQTMMQAGRGQGMG